MTFATPWLLLGLPLAVLPWLPRRGDVPAVRWGAMRLLRTVRDAPGSPADRRRRNLLRSAILAAGTIGFAGPRTDGEVRPTLVLVDASASMDAEYVGGTPFARAEGIARGLVAGNMASRVVLVPERTETGPGFGRFDPVAAAEAAGRFLDERPEGRVVLLSDFTAADWDAEAARKAWIGPLAPEEIEFVRACRTDELATAGNVSLTAIEGQGRAVVAGEPVRLTVSARSRRKPPTPVSWTIASVPSGSSDWIPAGEDRWTSTLETVFPTAGPVAVVSRVETDDALPIDDERRAVVFVRKRLRVAVVPLGGDGGAFRRVLVPPPGTSPAEAGDFASPFRADVVPEGHLTRALRDGFDLAVLLGGTVSDGEAASALLDFVDDGSGMLMTLGVGGRTDGWPLRAGDGLIEAIGEVTPGPLSPMVSRADHPSVARLTAGVAGPFGLDRIGSRRDVTPAKDSVVPLRLGDGPGLIVAAPGAPLDRRGRLALFAGPLTGAGASPWPELGDAYLPFVHETLRFLAGDDVRPQVACGARSVVPVAGPFARVRWTDEDGDEVIDAAEDGRADAPSRPGIYQADTLPRRLSPLAVDVDPAEGDLAPWDGVWEELPLLRDRPSPAAPVDHSQPWLLAALVGLLIDGLWPLARR